MHRSTTRFTTAAAVAALLALPVAGAAQTTGTAPTQQPPSQPQPQDPTPQPQQPPATTPEQQPATAGQVDANAAKKHLSDAREALSQITSMPEAAKLQGEARTQVTQLIGNFNELITTQSNWRAAFTKVDANLTSLLGPDSGEPAPASTATAGTSGTAGTAGATGTTGSTPAAGASASLEPAIKTKLTEVRSHLKLFEKAAGGGAAAADPMPPSAATGSTTSPANPTTSMTPASPDPASPSPASPTAATSSQPPSSSGAVGTSGVTASPTATMAPADQAKAADQVANSEADKHLDAISEILNKSKTGALTKDETTELKKHVEQLRTLLKQR